MPDDKKPAAKQTSTPPLRPKTPNPVKVQKSGSESFSHSDTRSKPAKKATPKPDKKSDS